MKKPVFEFDFKTRHAGISALITIAVLAAAVLINLLAGELNLQADLTPRKLYSLTDETLELLDNLDEPIEILALYRPGTEPANLMEAVEQYSRKSRLVTVSVVDPDRSPVVLARFAEGEETVPRGSFIVAAEKEFRVIAGMDLYSLSVGAQGQPQILGQRVEQQISAAIAYVTTGFTPVIYEIVGHGETPLASLGFSSTLEQANYVLDELSLLQSSIPEDAALVTLIGPRADLNRVEAEKLDAYLESGGAVFVALSLTSQPMDNLYELLQKWDIAVREGLVLETRQNRLPADFGGNPFIFFPFQAEGQEVLTSLAESNLDPLIVASMGLAPTDARQRQLEYLPLLQSSPESRLRTDLVSEQSGNQAVIPGDEPGPVDLAIAVKQRNLDNYAWEGATIVALGSSSTLQGMPNGGQIKPNVDMVMLLINWAVGEEGTINVDSKSTFRLPLNIGGLNSFLYAGLTMVIIPLACIIAALAVYFRRRHK